MLMFLIPLLLAILITRLNATNIECVSDDFCESTLRKGSKCVEGFCDNPFQYGCLRSIPFPGYERKLRTCNSEDSEDASSRGLCQPSGLLSGLEYKEIRLLSQNWESSFFEVGYNDDNPNTSSCYHCCHISHRARQLYIANYCANIRPLFFLAMDRFLLGLDPADIFE